MVWSSRRGWISALAAVFAARAELPSSAGARPRAGTVAEGHRGRRATSKPGGALFGFVRARAVAFVLLVVASALAAGCASQSGVGAQTPYYEAVLGGAPFTRLVIEIDHAPGREPGAEAIAHLEMTMRNITQKTDVEVKVDASLPSAAKTWTADDLRALELETRTTAHAMPIAVLHVLYPAGEYEKPGVAGVTIAGPVIGPTVVFLDTLREYLVPVENPVVPSLALPEDAVRIVERSTLLHEAGHAFGLVNNGIDPVCPHEDAEHPAHSQNEDSVMYFAVDSLEGVKKMLTDTGQVPDTFDAHDLQDIQAGGGVGLPRPAAC